MNVRNVLLWIFLLFLNACARSWEVREVYRAGAWCGNQVRFFSIEETRLVDEDRITPVSSTLFLQRTLVFMGSDLSTPIRLDSCAVMNQETCPLDDVKAMDCWNGKVVYLTDHQLAALSADGHGEPLTRRFQNARDVVFRNDTVYVLDETGTLWKSPFGDTTYPLVGQFPQVDLLDVGPAGELCVANLVLTPGLDTLWKAGDDRKCVAWGPGSLQVTFYNATDRNMEIVNLQTGDLRILHAVYGHDFQWSEDGTKFLSGGCIYASSGAKLRCLP